MFWHKTLSNILAYNFTQYICTQQYTIYWHITLQTVYQYNYTQYIGTHFLEYIGTQLHMKYWNTDYWRKNLHNILAFNFSLYIGTQLNEIYWHKWGLDIRVCEAFCVAIFCQTPLRLENPNSTSVGWSRSWLCFPTGRKEGRN